MTDLQATNRSFEVQVDGQTPESWNEILAQFADASIYQTWAYGAVRWGARNLSHLVLRRKGKISGAAQVRIARVPMLPMGVAYLRWGPLCHVSGTSFDPAIVAAMVARLRHEYANRRGLALQIIPPAFSGGDRAAAFHSAFDRAGMRPEPSLGNYRTVVVDLSPAPEILRKKLDQKWRNQLNRSEKNGLVLEVSDRRDAYREFVRLYICMRERKQFETSVDVEEFDRIHERLCGSEKMQTFLARKDNQTVGALVCSLMGGTAIYLLGATNEAARELKASYLLHWQAMMWLKDRGARWYDLGGIDPEANPGGYHFKSGFGGLEAIQLIPHAASGSGFGEALLRGVLWLRRTRTESQTHVSASRF